MSQRSRDWQNYVIGMPAEHRLHGAILALWRQQGAAPATHAPREVPPEDLQRRLRACTDLLAVAAPHLGWVNAELATVPHVVFLTDADGIVLQAIGNQWRSMTEFGLLPGHDWSEASVGPNGAGTALTRQRPVVVVAPDQIVHPYDDCTCVGTPLRASDGSLIGALALSVCADDGLPERLAHIAHVAHSITQELTLRHELARAQAPLIPLLLDEAELRWSGLVQRARVLESAASAAEGPSLAAFVADIIALRQEVKARAFQKWVARGQLGGDRLRDWLEAEAELSREKNFAQRFAEAEGWIRDRERLHRYRETEHAVTRAPGNGDQPGRLRAAVS